LQHLEKKIKYYHSKLLLFGEYTVTTGGDALAIPLETFSGHWSVSSSSKHPDPVLLRLAAYLDNLECAPGLIFEGNKFREVLNSGYYFHSDIPYGYGLGSSGALTAAIFDCFYSGASALSVVDLKKQLAMMESFFHGTSSGTDPLVSYLNKAVRIKAQHEVEVPDSIPWPVPGYNFFLLDTGIARSTAPLMRKFSLLMEDSSEYASAVAALNAVNNAVIENIICGNHERLWDYMTEISLMQTEVFSSMIPRDFTDLWKKGLNTGNFLLKLCGAGGGGMIMGVTKDINDPKELFEGYKVIHL
jgi:mevalonate kinase